jgi:hypothetical protein
MTTHRLALIALAVVAAMQTSGAMPALVRVPDRVTIHKIMAGLLDAYQLAANQQALAVRTVQRSTVRSERRTVGT